ncbi:hypothetical protein AB0E96_26500 [Kitasatospora sp. NPDC036755]|uniref:hypothetical protein n=1 Tax=Kitasatospora sp. NPDC036755 TaxID=3154600 RepID=UPI0033FF0E33
MTMPAIGPAPSTVLRAALRLYPERYRRERGEELTEVFADTTAAGGRAAVAREVLGLAVYGLRVRLGLTGGSAAGRLLALIAPMIAGALAGTALMPWIPDPGWITFRLTWDHSLLTKLEVFVPPVGAVLLLVAAALGRWTMARAVTLALGVLPLYRLLKAFNWPEISAWWVGFVGISTVPFLLGALLLVAAPTDLLPRGSVRGAGLVLASALGGGLLSGVQQWNSTSFPVEREWFVLMLIAPVLLALTALRGWLVPTAVGVVALAVTGTGSLFNIWRESGGVTGMAPKALPALLVLAAVAMAVRWFDHRWLLSAVRRPA